MEKHKLDQLFEEKLGNYQSQPGENAWSSIESALDGRKNKSTWTWVSIAASVILVGFSFWYLLGTEGAETPLSYDYAANSSHDIEVPIAIVYVPVFIQTQDSPVEDNPQLLAEQTTDNVPKSNELMNIAPEVKEDMAFNSDNTAISDLTQIELPVYTEPEFVIAESADEEMLMASAADVINEPAHQQMPVTIIYKQGEPKKESNFVRAVKHMEEVRMGEKKLVNFEKLRKSFRSKFKSEKDVNTK